MGYRTPVVLITGSLGCGKTTLLKRILHSGIKRFAVLMNEFGEVAVDSRVIRGMNVDIIELTGGCVCCSLTGEFEAAVREVIARAKPEVIVVEATGVAEADALVYEVEDNLPEVRLDSVIFIVDAYASTRHPYVSQTMRAQLSAADIVLINKIDLVTNEEIREVESRIREFNRNVLSFKTVGCDIDPYVLFGLDFEKRSLPLTHHGEPAFESFSFTTEAPLDSTGFYRLVAGLPESVYRAKGFVRFRDSTYLFNYVVGRSDLEKFDADTTQLVFIGRRLENVRGEILARLKECELQDAL